MHDINVLEVDLSRTKTLSNQELIIACENNVNAIHSLFLTEQLIEGNESFISKLFISIGDTIFHILNNFKTIFKAYRDFKRSELRYYIESNRIKTNVILNSNFSNIKHILVPIPQGMTTTYYRASAEVNSFLLMLNMPVRVKSVYEFVEKINIELTDTTISSSKDFIKSVDTKELKDLFYLITEKIFTKKQTNEIRLDNVYSNSNDLKAVIQLLLKMEEHMVGVSSMFSYMENISDTVDDIIAKLEDKNNTVHISPNSLSLLANSVRTIAVLFEKYGVMIELVNKLNHNQVEVLKVLEKEIK